MKKKEMILQLTARVLELEQKLKALQHDNETLAQTADDYRSKYFNERAAREEAAARAASIAKNTAEKINSLGDL